MQNLEFQHGYLSSIAKYEPCMDSYQYTLPEVETQVNDLRLKSQLNSGDPLVSLKLPVMVRG